MSSMRFFRISPGTKLFIEFGGDWQQVHGNANLGVPFQPGLPFRVQIIEGNDKHRALLHQVPEGTLHNFRLEFPEGSRAVRYFTAQIISSEAMGNAVSTSLDGEAVRKPKRKPGVVEDFAPCPSGTVAPFARNPAESALDLGSGAN